MSGAKEFVDAIIKATTVEDCPAWRGGSCRIRCTCGQMFNVQGRGEGRCPKCRSLEGYKDEQHACKGYGKLEANDAR